MAVQEPKKSLRIGIFRGKQRLEENVVKKRCTVSIGQDESNTFCILSSAVPKKHNLFEYDSNLDVFTLCVTKSMKGRIFIDNKVSLDLGEEIRPNKNVVAKGDGYRITLTNQSRGRVIIGKISILFQFVLNHDEMAAARLLYRQPTFAEKMSEFFPRAVVYCLIASFFIHLIVLTIICVQDWPRNDDLLILPMRGQVAEIGEFDTEEEEEEEDKPEIVEEADNVLPEVQSEEPEPEPDPGTVTKEELMDQITDKHREQGAMITAQILGVDGGVEGFYADMLGANSHIADMSDIAAGDIGTSASGNLLNQLSSGSSGQGAGLLGIDNGGNSGPKVVVDNKKNESQRAKVSFSMKANSSEFASAPPPGSKESVESMFKKKQGDIKSCYQRVMNAQGKANGRFVIAITVNKDGTVLQVKKIEDQIGGEMFNCVKQRIMNWKFGTLKSPIAFKKTWVFS